MIQLRADSRFYQGLTFLDGKKVQKSLKTDQLHTAFKLGEDWYKKLLRASVEVGRQHPLDRLAVDPTVAEIFSSYKTTLTKSKQAYASMKWGPIADFWRTLAISEVTPQTFREFYKWRRRHKTREGQPIKTHSLHKDVMVIRQVLRYAVEEGHIPNLPIIPKVGTIVTNPRPWLTRSEWNRLLAVSETRIKEAAGNEKVLRQRRDLHDQMVFMVASMCRVGEMLALRFNDCRIETNSNREQILVAHVTGKHGARTVVALREAADVIARRYRAAGEKNNALVFEEHHRDAFKELLKTAKLYRDNEGFTRNFKSLRATSISFRLLDSPEPNLLLIARNAGTSLAMVDTFYAKRLSAEMGVDELTARKRPKQLIDTIRSQEDALPDLGVTVLDGPVNRRHKG